VVALNREIECIQRLLSELPEMQPILEKNPDQLQNDFIAFEVGISMVWERLQKIGIIAPYPIVNDDGPSAA
jgi:hypothetical protein